MPPFTVLHVCMGNICRSPMAERLLALAIQQRIQTGSSASFGAARQRSHGDSGPPLALAAGGSSLGDELVHSHSAGTGGWHAGEEMNPPAARQVRQRGGDDTGFAARKLRSDLIDAADLVLTATADQQEYVVALRPDAAERTFVLGEFGRLLAEVDPSGLPSAGMEVDAVYARGVALVETVDVLRAGASPLPGDDLDDPWGRGDQCFGRVADEIEDTVRRFAALLLPGGQA